MSIADEKIPVFEHPPLGEISLDDCFGWVSDAAEACELLLRESEAVKREDGIEIPGLGKSVFGGVVKGQIRVATDNGPYRDARGLYRWQPCFSPFYDSVANAGKPTPLNNVHIYKR
jgi:hypothetical protein